VSRAYLINRTVQMVFTLWAVLTIIFFMFRLIPADPAALLVDQSLSPEAQQRLLEIWGLDRPLPVQYISYLGSVARGDFGSSFRYRAPVMSILLPFLANSMALMLPSILLATVLAIVVGSIMGWRRGSRLERWGVVVPLFLHSVPLYWLGILVLMVFSFWLGWFPSGGMRELGYEDTGFWNKYLSWDFLHHLILPMLTAVLYFTASPLMLMRSSMIEVRNEEFLDVIRAKGVSEGVVMRHAVRNALLPVVTYLALLVTLAVAGSVLLETVFAWPGIGRAIVDAVGALDYPVAQAAFFIWAASVVFMNFLVDILYHRLDPRISH
jgi:peptide/nickel transport system permease protein